MFVFINTIDAKFSILTYLLRLEKKVSGLNTNDTPGKFTKMAKQRFTTIEIIIIHTANVTYSSKC